MLLRLSLVHQNPWVLPVRRGVGVFMRHYIAVVIAAFGCNLLSIPTDDSAGDEESGTTTGATSSDSTSESTAGQDSGSSGMQACPERTGPYEACSFACMCEADGFCVLPILLDLTLCSYECESSDDCPDSPYPGYAAECSGGNCIIPCSGDGTCPDGLSCINATMACALPPASPES